MGRTHHTKLVVRPSRGESMLLANKTSPTRTHLNTPCQQNQPPTHQNYSMSVFASIGLAILSMLIMSSLQIVPAVFALFYHYALGKRSRHKASILGLFFILGTEVISACLFLSSYYLVNLLFLGEARPENGFVVWLAAGVTLALAFSSFFFYYHKNNP